MLICSSKLQQVQPELLLDLVSSSQLSFFMIHLSSALTGKLKGDVLQSIVIMAGSIAHPGRCGAGEGAKNSTS